MPFSEPRKSCAFFHRRREELREGSRDELCDGTRSGETVCSGFTLKQDWHYASIRVLSVCIAVRIISTKTAPEKFAIISRIRRVRSYTILAVQRYDNNATEAMKAHVNVLHPSAMTMGSTSCKLSQDFSKRSREQIQPINVSTPQNKKRRLYLASLRRMPNKQVGRLKHARHHAPSKMCSLYYTGWSAVPEKRKENNKTNKETNKQRNRPPGRM